MTFNKGKVKIKTMRLVKKSFNAVRKNLALIYITILGFLIRTGGIMWGIPYILHNDESVTVRSSLGMRFGDLNPHHFDWPSLYFYINYAVFWFFIKLRTQLQILFGVDKMRELFPFWWGPEMPFYVLGRIISATFSTVTIFLVYKISKEVTKNKKTSLLASLFFSLSYLSVYFSYYALSDNALTFFMTTALYFTVKTIKKPKYKNYILSGIMIGLATAIKYTGFLSGIILMLAHFIRKEEYLKPHKKDAKLLLAGIISLLTFFISVPYALLDWETFINTQDATGAFWQIKHIGKAPNWLYHLGYALPLNFGWPLALVGFLGIIMILIQKNKELRIVAISFLVFIAYIGSWGITRWHYTLPMVPLLSISSAYAIEKIRTDNKIKILLIIGLLIIPIYKISVEIIKRNNTDTRILAGQWIEKNIPKGSVISTTGNKTGYYGGQNPIFNWEEYKVIKKKANKKEKSLYTINKEREITEDNSSCVIFENKWSTGPKIQICKLPK